MSDTYRTLCADLVDDLEMSDWPSKLKEAFRVDIARARALLAQPEAEGPTDEELLRLAREWNSGFESIELQFAADYARAVLSKWGHQ